MKHLKQELAKSATISNHGFSEEVKELTNIKHQEYLHYRSNLTIENRRFYTQVRNRVKNKNRLLAQIH